jgi:hypothetical protein
MSRQVIVRHCALVGFVLSGVIALLFAFSVWYTFGYLGRAGGVMATSGLLLITTDSVSPGGLQVWAHASRALYWLPSTSGPFVTIPLWPLFVAAFIPSAIGWRRSRRRRPGHCRKCRYDLTGNLSGICPECGTPVEPDQATLTS